MAVAGSFSVPHHQATKEYHVSVSSKNLVVGLRLLSGSKMSVVGVDGGPELERQV